MGYLNGRPGSAIATAAPVTSSLAALLTGAAINTKGAYVDIWPTTDQPAGFVIIDMQPAGVAGAQALVDIAVGASGQEHLVLRDLGVQSGTGFSAHQVAVPMSIPQGSTVRARYARSNASLTMRVGMKAFAPMSFQRRPQHVATYGATAATSRGTSVDPGATINTKGAWTQLTAATTAPTQWLMLHIGNQGNTARTDALYLVDIGIGAAAAEQVVVPNLMFMMDDTADEPTPSYIGPFPFSAPTGSRLSVRAQCTINDATDRLFDVIAYGGA